jgi:hypothetical protein
MKKTIFYLLFLVLGAAAGSLSAATLFTEYFENPDVTGYAQGTAPSDWIKATAGFGGNRHGLLDQDSGNFISPDTNNNQQVYAFRYTNSGLTSKPDRIGPLVDGITYSVSFDVVQDTQARPYRVQLIAFTDGAARWDARSTPAGSRMLLQVTGNAPTNGSFKTVSFDVTGDTNTHAGVLWYDLGVRFLGATTSANIDNVVVTNDLPPDTTPPTLSSSNIVDNKSGGPISATEPLVFTVTFDERLDVRTVSTNDFANGGTAAVSIDRVTETAHGVYLVDVTPLTAGTLVLQIPVGATLDDLSGNAMVTTAPIPDDTEITVEVDTFAPSLNDIADDQSGNSIGTNTIVTYTVTFSEDIDSNTVAAVDFANAASSAISVGTIIETAPGTFSVPVRATTGNGLRLRVIEGSVADAAGNVLTNRSTLTDDVLFTVDGVAPMLLPTNITDNATNGFVDADIAVTYTLTFSEDMNASSLTAGDFNNAGTAAITFGAITETSNGVFTVQVTPITAGTLRLRLRAGARVLDAVGNSLITSVAILDDETIPVVAETIPPTLLSIADNRAGGPVNTNTLIMYTVTFDEEMNAATVTAADFTNALDAPITIDSVTQDPAGVFTVVVNPLGEGNVQLTIPAGAVLTDPSGNALDTGTAISDDTTISVTIFRPLFFEDFETPTSPTDYEQGTRPGAWVGATAGFNASHHGITDKAGNDFGAPDPNQQAYAFRYSSNAGITSRDGQIEMMRTGITYEVSFDVVRDDGRNDLNDRAYSVQLVAFADGAVRSDIRSTPAGSQVLASANGNAPAGGAFDTVAFTLTSDINTHAASIGLDMGIRFRGSFDNAIIDNVRVIDNYKPTPPIVVDMNDNVAGGPSEANQWLTYTVSFNEDMDAETVTVDDFAYTGTVHAVFGDVSETAPGVFSVEIRPLTNGTLQLYIPTNTFLLDAERDVMDTSVAIFDNTNVIISVDQTAPLLTNITDSAVNGLVALNRFFTYTVFFNEMMTPGSFDAADFSSAGTAPIVIGAITNIGPNTFTVDVMPTSNGTIRLQIPTNAVLLDSFGNALDTSAPILDDDTLSVDTNGPSLLDMVDDRGGAAIEEVNIVTYTLTFNEDIDASTLNANDFGNASNSVMRMGTISETAPGIFTVEVMPKNVDGLQLQIVPGASILDANGVPMDTGLAIADDTNITVTATFLPEDTLLYDDFESGLGNWSADNNAGLYTFSGGGFDYATQGTNAANIPGSGNSSITLTAPLPLIEKAYSNVTVRFDWYFQNGSSTRRGALQYAANGTTFADLQTFNTSFGGQPPDGSTSFTLNANNYTFTDEAKFRIRFSSNQGSHILNPDRIQISATPIWVPPPPPTALVLIVR